MSNGLEVEYVWAAHLSIVHLFSETKSPHQKERVIEQKLLIDHSFKSFSFLYMLKILIFALLLCCSLSEEDPAPGKWFISFLLWKITIRKRKQNLGNSRLKRQWEKKGNIQMVYVSSVIRRSSLEIKTFLLREINIK